MECNSPIPSIDWPSVWETHGNWLKSVLHARLRSRDEVDEVFQEIALLIARKPCSWPAPDKIAPWLYRVTIQQVWLFRRKRTQPKNAMSSNAQLDMAVADCDPVQLLIGLEDQQQVRSALANMSGQDREILWLKHAEKWTYDQICDHTGISRDKVIYRIGRARRRLKLHLNAKVEGENHE